MRLALGLLAGAGWMVASVLGVRWLCVRRRLELVARAEHELRSPVTALALAIEVLGRRPELRRSAAALDAHLDRLRLGLADLAAARSGERAQPLSSEVSVEPLARAVSDGWGPAASAQGREVRLDWTAGAQSVRTDPARLSQALGNLVGNALEHGRGEVAIRGERRDGRLRIEVTDAGVGEARGEPCPPRGGAPPGVSGQTTTPHRRDSATRADRGRGLTIALSAVRDAGGTLDLDGLARPQGSRRSTAVGIEPLSGPARAVR